MQPLPHDLACQRPQQKLEDSVPHLALEKQRFGSESQERGYGDGVQMLKSPKVSQGWKPRTVLRPSKSSYDSCVTQTVCLGYLWEGSHGREDV